MSNDDLINQLRSENAILTATLDKACNERDAARSENERLKEALVDHNDLLRSAFQAAQRDAIHETTGTTNYRRLADRASEVLGKHHEVTNESRLALKENSNGE